MIELFRKRYESDIKTKTYLPLIPTEAYRGNI